jgi:Zinc carboxypeptidase
MSSDLLTLAEQSAFRQTGRSDEVDRLCAAFAARWPDAVRAIRFGTSGEGRPMQALLVTRTGALTARALKQSRVPLLFLQAGIHPGESDGKDAGFIVLRDWLEQSDARLQQIAVLFVPAFNVDGHERMGRWNRMNQRGPEETGWRTNACNLNLNRDYCKADSPEMRSLLGLIGEWDPLLTADLHVTDGADFQPDISLQVEPLNQGAPELYAASRQLRDAVIDDLQQAGSLPLPFYPDLYRADDPSSGFVLTVYSPRFSTGYFAQRNRFTLLIETHSWKPYPTRVKVTCDTIRSIGTHIARHGAQWLQLAQSADEAARRIGGSDAILEFRSSWREPTGGNAAAGSDDENAAAATLIDFPGYAYSRTRSPVSGEVFTTYDPSTPEVWRVPYRERVEPALVVRLPAAGYLVPAAWAGLIGERLRCHGIQVQLQSTPVSALAVETFRASSVLFSSVPFEGRMRATLQGEWQQDSQNLEPGALYVPLDQPLARLVVTLLEPQAPDSFAAWGFFNACFEQKEHLERYIAEQIAQQMMDADAALRAAFEQRLHDDAGFAGNPDARLEFFLRRHGSWDDRYHLYPVVRLAQPRPQA